MLRKLLLDAIAASGLSDNKLSLLATGGRTRFLVQSIRKGHCPRIDKFEALASVLGLDAVLRSRPRTLPAVGGSTADAHLGAVERGA